MEHVTKRKYRLHVIDSPTSVCHIEWKTRLKIFLDCPLYYVQRLALRNTVSMFSHSIFETLLCGDDNLDNETNIVIVLAVHEFIKDSESLIVLLMRCNSVPLIPDSI